MRVALVIRELKVLGCQDIPTTLFWSQLLHLKTYHCPLFEESCLNPEPLPEGPLPARFREFLSIVLDCSPLFPTKPCLDIGLTQDKFQELADQPELAREFIAQAQLKLRQARQTALEKGKESLQNAMDVLACPERVSVKVGNRVLTLDTFSSKNKANMSIPQLTSPKGACSEIHIFLGPILTDTNDQLYEKTVEQYKAAVARWNQDRRPQLSQRDAGQVEHAVMKAPVLTLIFRNGSGEQPITVCQSARYVFCNDVNQVQKLADEDVEFFKSLGFTVLRKKIEAMAHGIQGVPKTAVEAKLWPHLYFEFHIKIEHIDSEGKPSLVTAAEEAVLRKLADKLSLEHRLPIPLSYNREKNENNVDNGGCQRFFNVRLRGLGIGECDVIVGGIKTAIKELGFRVPKVISEFVWSDDNAEMDLGWIDYSPQEQEQLLARLATTQ